MHSQQQRLTHSFPAVLKLQLPSEALATRKVILEVQQPVDPASDAAQAAAKQQLQSIPEGSETDRMHALWKQWKASGMHDPTVADTAAAGMAPSALRTVLEGWEAAGEMGYTFAEKVVGPLVGKDGWSLGWEQPRFFRKDVLLDGRKVAAGHISYGFLLRDRAALKGMVDAQSGKLRLPDSEEQYTIRYDGLPVRVFSLSGVQGVEPQQWAKAVEAAGIPVLAAAWAMDQQQRPCRNAVKLALAVTGSVPSAVEMPVPEGTGSFYLQLRECADAVNLSDAHRMAPAVGMAREWVAGRSQQLLEA